MSNNPDGLGYFYIDPLSKDTNPNTGLVNRHSIGNVGDHGPGGGGIKFANFADLIVFWEIVSNQLWLSDLPYQNPSLIFTDTARTFSYRPVWSPDDLLLVFRATEEDHSDLIYHLKNNSLEPWNYTCDRVGVSPHSARLAVWCVSKADEGKFAVMEWGGEIWYSEAPPENELVSLKENKYTGLGLYSILGFSGDGEQVAYFDPEDPEGHLFIADAQGIKQKILPGSAYWLSEPYQLLTPLMDKPIEWSEDGSKVLVLGRGDEASPCPSTTLLSGEYPNDACWQVVDAKTGKVIWKLPDALPEVVTYTDYQTPNSLDFSGATISADGRYLAVTGIVSPDRVTFIVDLETNQLIWLDSLLYALGMRWGDAP